MLDTSWLAYVFTYVAGVFNDSVSDSVVCWMIWTLVSIESYFFMASQFIVKPFHLAILTKHTYLLHTLQRIADIHSHLQYNIAQVE